MGDFIIVTTNSVPGYEIESCYGYLSISFVVGASWFRDFGSSITDIVGGVSTGYTEEVTRLKERAKVAIKNKAKLLGLNGITGFKVDVDPVFGSGYSMFMVSAIGTGIKLKITNEGMSQEEIYIREGLNDFYTKVNSTKRLNGVSILESENYELEELLVRIGKNNKECIIEKIIEECEKGSLSKLSKDLVKREVLKEYFHNGDLSGVKELLLRNMSEKKSVIARTLEIIDYKIILEELKKVKDSKEELALLFLLDIKTPYISSGDFSDLIKLQKYLKEKYNKEVEIRMSTFKKKQTWICKKCGGSIDMDRESCHMCGTNRYGVISRFTSEGVFISLEKRFEFLDELEIILSRLYK